jgi:glycogen synthase
MAHQYPGRVNAVIDYNEALAHQIYAGSDFLIMPSRVEPCGLNQMYAMRYGAIPMVRSVGGLKDTVPDIATPGDAGRGIRFDQFSLNDIGYAIHRGAAMWHNDPGIVAVLRQRIMSIDFSWEKTVDKYFSVYQRIGARIEKIRQSSETSQESGQMASVKTAKKSAPKKVAAGSEAPPKPASQKPKAGSAPKEKAKKKKT